jgi:hypothetical protein
LEGRDFQGEGTILFHQHVGARDCRRDGFRLHGGDPDPVANGPELHRATEIGFLPTEEPPLAQPRQIRFAADRPDVTLLRLDDAGWSGWRALLGRDVVNEPAYRLVPVCVAPCDATVTPATWYAVGGNDIVRTLAFQMHDDATTLRPPAPALALPLTQRPAP